MSEETRREKLIARNRAGRSSFRYEDKAWMVEAYVERRLSLRELAREAECGLRTVARWMAIHEIPTRKEPRRGPEHHAWKRGGPAPCPTCGAPRKSYNQSRQCLSCRDRRGELNPNWRGDAIRSGQAHARVRTARGWASEHPCEHCGKPAAEDWAYDHSDPNEVQSTQGPYSVDISRYKPLCKVCHKRFDLDFLAKRRAAS